MSRGNCPIDVNQGIADDIKALRKTIEELSLDGPFSAAVGNDPGDRREVRSMCSAQPGQEETDSFDATRSGGRMSPLLTAQVARSRIARARRRPEDEQYIHSVSETHIGRLRSRRRSDPGRISVSPLRSRLRLDSDMISEDGSSDDEFGKHKLSNPRLTAIKCSREVEEIADVAELATVYAKERPRSRSPHLLAARRKGRSQSLPGPDPALIEIGEAIGAVAVSKPEPLLEVPRATSPVGSVPRRRRSVSVECTPLEAIVEEGITQRNSRRFSTPVNAMTGPK